jgi:hypothetical protein
MATTPLSGMLSGVSIKDCKETLAAQAGVIDHERMGIFHIPSRTLIFRYANLIGIILCRVAVQHLGGHKISKSGDRATQMIRTP